MMHAQHLGTCASCGRSYSIGARIEVVGMADMGTPFQRWLYRHAGCPPVDVAAAREAAARVEGGA
jgi:hypothetical protein